MVNSFMFLAYAQIQTHQLLQQHKQQFVIQQQQSRLSQPSVQSQGQAVQTVAIQPALAGQQCAIPVLHKPPAQQAAIFHSTVSPRMLNGQSPLLNPSKVKQVQLTAVNLQFQPPRTHVRQVPTYFSLLLNGSLIYPSSLSFLFCAEFQTLVTTQDNSEKDTAVPPTVRDDCLGQSEQQLLSQTTPEATPEQCLYEKSQLTVNAEGSPMFSVTAQYDL